MPELNSLPPNTLATFPAIVTSTRQDRDGDVLWQHIPDMPIGRTLML